MRGRANNSFEMNPAAALPKTDAVKPKAPGHRLRYASIINATKVKPKIVNHNLAAVGVSYGPEVFNTPNVFFSLLSITARARINIEELVSTPTELIFIVTERDFSRTVALFSELHRQTHT